MVADRPKNLKSLPKIGAQALGPLWAHTTCKSLASYRWIQVFRRALCRAQRKLRCINQLLALSTRWLRFAYKPDGFNIGVNIGKAAGAGVPVHIHWHILPRWNGDVNFMTTLADVRVIPQSLADSYARLKEAIFACA